MAHSVMKHLVTGDPLVGSVANKWIKNSFYFQGAQRPEQESDA